MSLQRYQPADHGSRGSNRQRAASPDRSRYVALEGFGLADLHKGILTSLESLKADGRHAAERDTVQK